MSINRINLSEENFIFWLFDFCTFDRSPLSEKSTHAPKGQIHPQKKRPAINENISINTEAIDNDARVLVAITAEKTATVSILRKK